MTVKIKSVVEFEVTVPDNIDNPHAWAEGRLAWETGINDNRSLASGVKVLSLETVESKPTLAVAA